LYTLGGLVKPGQFIAHDPEGFLTETRCGISGIGDVQRLLPFDIEAELLHGQSLYHVTSVEES
jgi:hypothetical protein